MRLKQLHSDLWITESPQRFGGVEVGTRMTVVRLAGGQLWLHSPIPLAPELGREIEELGQVAYLIAPNRLHHLYIADWHRAYPGASLFAAPGLDKKRSDLKVAAVLTDAPQPDWAETVDQIVVQGFPFASEVVFFHRPSSTLIATDLAFNIASSSPALTRLVFRLGGAYGRLAPTLLERVLVRDRDAFRDSLERILEWPFERVVVAHGEVVETEGRAKLASGFQWVLG